MSIDLGLSYVEVILGERGVRLPGGYELGWSELEKIAADPNGCFLLTSDGPERIQRYSDRTERFYSLMPTAAAPTLLNAGFPMHRIKALDPWRDTTLKVRCLRPVFGVVLDTATGLGYTAIQLSASADKVITVELDAAVLEIARVNPWSRDLFGNERIEVTEADVLELISEFPDRFFDRIMHDPPSFALAGELYSASFYRELHRALKPRGRLFHYIGDFASPTGRRVLRGVMRRLADAGFGYVKKRAEAFGVLAYP